MNRRSFALLATLVLSACPADDEDDGGATTLTTQATTDGSTAGTTGSVDESSGGGMAGPPAIESIVWTQVPGCMMGTASDVTLVATVSDPDTATADLTFDWNVVGCSTMIEDAAEVTILCPQVAPYSSTLTVSDPEGGEDDLEFSIPVCMDGMAP